MIIKSPKYLMAPHNGSSVFFTSEFWESEPVVGQTFLNAVISVPGDGGSLIFNIYI